MEKICLTVGVHIPHIFNMHILVLLILHISIHIIHIHVVLHILHSILVVLLDIHIHI